MLNKEGYFEYNSSCSDLSICYDYSYNFSNDDVDNYNLNEEYINVNGDNDINEQFSIITNGNDNNDNNEDYINIHNKNNNNNDSNEEYIDINNGNDLNTSHNSINTLTNINKNVIKYSEKIKKVLNKKNNNNNNIIDNNSNKTKTMECPSSKELINLENKINYQSTEISFLKKKIENLTETLNSVVTEGKEMNHYIKKLLNGLNVNNTKNTMENLREKSNSNENSSTKSDINNDIINILKEKDKEIKSLKDDNKRLKLLLNKQNENLTRLQLGLEKKKNTSDYGNEALKKATTDTKSEKNNNKISLTNISTEGNREGIKFSSFNVNNSGKAMKISVSPGHTLVELDINHYVVRYFTNRKSSIKSFTIGENSLYITISKTSFYLNSNNTSVLYCKIGDSLTYKNQESFSHLEINKDLFKIIK
eukprot:jgi/Orpsp1_1/1174239/evm.model.c7180000049376.1